jgi:CRISPR/Cas system CSM-associated protein Csm4 (group 5 of RAMP superfamily)
MYKETLYFTFFEIFLFSFSIYQLTGVLIKHPEQLIFNEKKTNIEMINKIKSEVRKIKVDEVQETKTEIKEVKNSFKKINQKRIENQIISHESDDADIIWLE